MPEHHNRMTIEQMRTHLARAKSELEATQRCLDPQTGDVAELDVVKAVANARLSLSDALETIRLITGEPSG